ncbi:MAG: penicillin-binding protein 2 [Ruminococcus sp.]|nr:penicillin-binding protein 2 [Ruminococcus sp.]
MRKSGEHGILILTSIFFLIFFGISLNFFRLSTEQEHVQTARESSFITIHAGDSFGTIYDRNFKPLVNEKTKIVAVVLPSAVELTEIEEIAEDKEEASEKYAEGKPFAFRCRKKGTESAGLTFFEIPERYSGNVIAPHTIGYISENSGASGLEYAFDMLLRTGNTENSVTYPTDGFGHILIGGEKTVIRSEKTESGVVTTLDSEIQSICEKAGSNIEKGAVIVSDVKNGEILALASFPEYDVTDISDSLDDENSPMINRALYSYSVGSIFKLITAAEGINEGFSGYISECTGECDIIGQIFRCHDADGHGVQDMTSAIVHSCNPYFISLSRCFDIKSYRSFAYSMGFGREIHLCAGMISSAGVLPSAKELLVPAELANFSFGQGKLTATPLQINQMTCAIANGGNLIMPRIVRGITVDGKTVGNEKSQLRSKVMTAETAAELRKMMIAAIYENESSNAAPDYVRAAAKTSTAQTGRFDEDDEELCHSWITGFFPASSPRYAVTVLVEDGGYGNDSAAPVFRDIVNMMCQRK